MVILFREGKGYHGFWCKVIGKEKPPGSRWLQRSYTRVRGRITYLSVFLGRWICTPRLRPNLPFHEGRISS